MYVGKYSEIVNQLVVLRKKQSTPTHLSNKQLTSIPKMIALLITAINKSIILKLAHLPNNYVPISDVVTAFLF